MALFENFMVDCRMVDRVTKEDEYGGFTSEWTDGARFRAAIVKDRELAARVAEKEGVTAVYTVTTEPGARLKYHDVFKRVSDGQIFRVTTNAKDGETPKDATFAFEQVNAERWELVND